MTYQDTLSVLAARIRDLKPSVRTAQHRHRVGYNTDLLRRTDWEDLIVATAETLLPDECERRVWLAACGYDGPTKSGRREVGDGAFFELSSRDPLTPP